MNWLADLGRQFPLWRMVTDPPLEFARPWALWLLLLVVPLAWLAWTTRAPLRRLRWWLALTARASLVLLVVCSLADVRWSRSSDEVCVLFLVDASRSTCPRNDDSSGTGPRALEEARNRIQAEVATMKDDDTFGIVLFGQRPVLRRPIGPKGDFALEPLDPQVADFTNIGRALRFAASQFPRQCRKRIVLLSDGNENLGSAVEEARSAAAGDIEIVVAPLAPPPGADVLVEQVIVPTRARPNQPVDLKASIRASRATEANVKIFRDQQLIGEGRVPLEAGSNVVHLANDVMAAPGFHRYEVLVEPPAGSDASPVNNMGLAYTQVYGEARVLYLEGFAEHGRRLAQALQTGAAQGRGGFIVDSGSVADLPQSIEEMARYDCIILSDIPASAMGEAQMTAFKHYVEQLGGGLIMLGGEKSLTTGGYVDTPVEEALPVSLKLEREKHLASLAMVIVVDKSGSMGMPVSSSAIKMDLANTACAAAVKLLDEYDQAAVCVVDTDPKWVAGKLRPMTPAAKGELIRNVMSVKPGGGGIYVKTGIYHAYEELRRANAQVKHLILFADAQDSEQQEGAFDLARRHLRQDQITLTAVGMGTKTDPHVNFLRTLSESCGGGRFYITDDVRKLPEIFAKDTYIVSRNALVEIKEGFAPAVASGAEAISNINWDQAPRLYGYVATMPKPKGEMLLLAKDDEPLLARWRFGLGKAAVFTSDAKDRWGRDWLAWGDFDRFWAQIVRWTMRDSVRGNVSTQVVTTGSHVRFICDAVTADGELVNGKMLSARIISPDPGARPEKLALHQVAPGRYAAEFDATITGSAYQVVVVDEETERIVDSAGAVLSYPPEFRDLEPNRALLNQVAEAARGTYTENLAGTFARAGRPVRALRSVWVWLLVAAVGLLVLDIASRRLVMPDWLAKRRAAAQRRVVDGAAVVAARLRQTREELRARQEQDLSMPPAGSGADGPLAAQLLKQRRPPASPPSAGSVAGLDEVVDLRPATSSSEARDEPGVTDRLLDAKRRARRHQDL